MEAWTMGFQSVNFDLYTECAHNLRSQLFYNHFKVCTVWLWNSLASCKVDHAHFSVKVCLFVLRRGLMARISIEFSH